MRKAYVCTLLAASATLLACAADGTYSAGENVGDQSEALPRQIDPTDPPVVIGGGGGGGGGGGTSVTYPQTPPKVLSRSVSGTQIVLHFDRVVIPQELTVASTTVQVIRRGASGFQTLNLASGTSLSADGKTLTINLTQAVRTGEVYFARSTWKKCTSSIFGTFCKNYRANLGEIVVSPRIVWGGGGLGGIGTVDGVMSSALGIAPIGIAPVAQGPSLITGVTMDPAPAAPAAGPGTFRVASTSPADQVTGVGRDPGTIAVTFDGGHLDCTRTSHGKDGFVISSQSPDLCAQQEMYEDQTATHPTDWFFKGSLRCDESLNQMIFTPPGLLFGDVWYHLDVTAFSKEGDQISATRQFRTARPGIIVYGERVENDYGSHDTCDSDGFFGSDNYCDIYVTSAIATGTNAASANRIPDDGDFSEMRYFPQDQNNGQRILAPEKVLFSTVGPIGEVVDLQFWAMDADTTSEWKQVLQVAGQIAVDAGKALAPFEPEAGAITTVAGEGLQGAASLISTNEDDKLGDGHYFLTLDANRWGTTASTYHEIDMTNNSPSRGPVKLYIRTEEFPRPWSPNGIIQ